MIAKAMTCRGAFALFWGFGLLGSVVTAQAQPGARFSNIRVNVAPLRANAGDPTAAWMEKALAEALPRALGPQLGPGGGALEVQIDWIYLGPSQGGTGPGGSSQDTITGSFIVRGPGGEIISQTPLRAISSYYPSAVDQAQSEQAYYWRVVALAQSFAGWAPRELGL